MRLLRVLLGFVILVPLFAAPAAAGAGMSWWQFFTSADQNITFDDCNARAVRALAAAGLSQERHNGSSGSATQAEWFGSSSSGPSSVYISCFKATDNTTMVTFLVASIPDANGSHEATSVMQKIKDGFFGTALLSSLAIPHIGLPPLTAPPVTTAQLGKHLIVEVLDSATKQPVIGALVSIIGPSGNTFSHQTTQANVGIGFKQLELAGTPLRIRVVANGYAESLQDISPSTFDAASPTYVVYLESGNSAPPRLAAGGSGWEASAVAFRGHNGERFRFTCEPNGHLNNVWGTDVYTDDSKVCSAAVHAGLITLQSGGTITIEMRPGQASYAGAARNGVSTLNYGSWYGSYAFVGP